ncbi:unnamed protein product, partial [Scytosiphon promiscuus]
MRELRVEDALLYLDQVKIEFGDKPEIYNEFLDIMKNFKAMAIDTPGVIRRVSSLFRGYNKLILGFNTFLPDGYKIELSDIEEMNREHERQLAISRGELPPDPVDNNGDGRALQPVIVLTSISSVGGSLGGVSEGRALPIRHHLPAEFDHAITYVTTIKKRFSHEPQTYKAFLEILHTYQKEQRGERQHKPGACSPVTRAPVCCPFSLRLMYTGSGERAVPQTNEQELMSSIKHALMSAGREYWDEFTKVLQLQKLEVLAREEMLHLVSDLLENNHPDLYAEFKRMVNEACQQGEVSEVTSEMWSNTPLNELDLTKSEKGGPSYRHLPKNFPLLSCSERTSAEQAVLNDVWVSVPVGSEGGGSDVAFKHIRKNVHEDLLFKCEDERFELDMVIEAGSSAIALLEPMADEIKTIDKTAGARYQFKMDRRVLSPVQLAAITRIYGDHGAEILELLRKNPCKTVPVILARLRQKDVEWRVSRERLNRTWALVQRNTYYKSLDRRSQDLKNEDKKGHSTKVLVADIMHRRTALLAKEEEPKPIDRAALAEAAGKQATNADARPGARGNEDDDGGDGGDSVNGKGKGKGKPVDAMETDDNQDEGVEGDAAGTMKEGNGAASAAAVDEGNGGVDKDGKGGGAKGKTVSSSSSSADGKVKAELGSQQNGGGGKAAEKEERQTLVEKKIAEHEAQVEAARLAKAEREKKESSPPHFMQPHLTLAYPGSDVRRDMHQVLLHAVRHSGNTPADKAKMLKALPSLRAWMGGCLSWEQMNAGHSVSKVYNGAVVRGIGTPLGSGLAGVKEGCVVLLRKGEARVTGVKKEPAPAGTPPAVHGGKPEDVLVEVEATMLSGGASVTVGAGDILQLRAEGVSLTPPSPLTEDSDGSPRSANASAAAWSGEGGEGREAWPALPESERMLLCTQELYVLMRIHHVLCERLGKAVTLSEAAKALKDAQKDHPSNPLVRDGVEADEDKLIRSLGLGGAFASVADKHSPPLSSEEEKEKWRGKGKSLRGYGGFLALLYAFTEQNTSELKLEDAVQLTVGNEAYMLFSYDKVMNAFLRQLKTVVDDDSSLKMLQLFDHQQAALGAFQPARFLSECRKVLKTKVDNLYRLQWSVASTDTPPSSSSSDDGASLLVELVMPTSGSSGGGGGGSSSSSSSSNSGGGSGNS